MNLASIIDPHPDDAVAIVSRGRTTTYGLLRQQVASIRGGLLAQGLKAGDPVAILCNANWYFAASYLSIVGAGMVAVPLNPTSPAPELQRQLALVGTRGIVVGPAGAKTYAGVDRSTLPGLDVVISGKGEGVSGAVVIDDLMDSEPSAAVDVDDDHPAVYMFTSGTAGSPKAAVLSHGNLRSNIDAVQAHPGRRQGPDDVTMLALPPYHIFGLNTILGVSLHGGGRVVMIERFDPASALESIVDHEVTCVSGVPAMWQSWAGLPFADPDALATVRVAASGAARLPEEVFDSVREKFGIEIAEGYGLTEASPVVTSSSGFPIKPGSIGVPVPGVEIRLVDEDGESPIEGDPGEIWVRGPGVFKGYYDDPDATAAALTDDGWLRTGDVAVVDDDDYLYLVDRSKDLIIVSGFNVYPVEVEEVLVEHPAVLQAAVVGIEHPHTGEAVKAYVVVSEDHAVEEDEIIDFVADRLARYKCPTKVAIVDELPVSGIGKVLRRELRDAG